MAQAAHQDVAEASAPIHLFFRKLADIVESYVVEVPAAPAAAGEPPPARRVPEPGDSFPEQWAYVTTATSLNAVCCSRQCGKTWGIRLRARLRACSKPGSKILYITLIKKNCRKLFFDPIREELRQAGWGMRTSMRDMIITLDNGSTIEAIGCDDSAGLGKIRGDNYDLVMIDEAQEPSSDVLEKLVDQVLGPQFVTRGGDIDLVGTPPDALTGYFIDAIDSSRWAYFNWTMFDAAKAGKIDITNVKKNIADRGLRDTDPVFQREYMGRHDVVDPSKLAYEYVEARNTYAAAKVDFEADGWRHALGLDLGFSDHDAVVVVAWRGDDPQRRLHVRWRWQHNHLDVDLLAGVVGAATYLYGSNVVGDHGGHGAVKVLETVANRLRLNLERKPGDVMVSVGFVNDDLRAGRLLLPDQDLETTRVLEAHEAIVAAPRKDGRPRDAELDVKVEQLIRAGGGADLAADMLRVTKGVKNGRVEINKKGFHSDLTEALRYAHHGARHWMAKAPRPPLTLTEQRIRAEKLRKKAIREPW